MTGVKKRKKNVKNERFTVHQTSSLVMSSYTSRSSTDHSGFESSECKFQENRKNKNIHHPAAPGAYFKIFMHFFNISEGHLSIMDGLMDLNFYL